MIRQFPDSPMSYLVMRSAVRLSARAIWRRGRWRKTASCCDAGAKLSRPKPGVGVAAHPMRYTTLLRDVDGYLSPAV